MKSLFLIFIVLILSMYLVLNLSFSQEIMPKPSISAKRDSCKTFIDFTLMLTTLSLGVFVLIPTALGLIRYRIAGIKKPLLFCGLFFLILSIVIGTIVIASLAGTQRMGEYDINNPITKLASKIQWGLSILGIIAISFILMFSIFQQKERDANELNILRAKAIIKLSEFYNEKSQPDKAIAVLERLVED
ncbi:MAG: hypothetical protein JRG73_02270 [Deltaproteobacteria bacterium]|nr:hypothetical protein [Deltaproteobacteria bacterium]